MRALQETGDRRQEAGEATLDVREIREMFPLLAGTVGGKPLVYLDNAATTQKPRVVLDTLSRYYAAENANIHRGVYQLSQNATQAYEGARGKVAAFLNAAEPAEIIFTRNATEGINLVAQTFGRWQVGEGDDVVISTMEHHSNIVPWQMLCEEKGARLRVVPITDAGELMLDELTSLLGPRTKLVSIVHMSNSLGTINPVRQVVELAHAQGIPVLIDGAQAAYHRAVDVQAIGCDFYVVTGHKLYGPTGIGALYGQRRWLEAMPPYQGGGDMISSVTFERTTYNKVPHKFEAGTPHIAGAIGLGAAV
ncbi:MAG: cysteine desulfurase, partial [Acidobacteriota bacterium]|nr:cysteine desulfurase [Acidobacteriota bacterium]